MSRTTTWRKEFEKEDIDGELVHTLSESELDIVFHCGYGGVNGLSFTAWDDTWVYFPIEYDGSEWIGKAPRNPCALKMQHQGG